MAFPTIAHRWRQLIVGARLYAGFSLTAALAVLACRSAENPLSPIPAESTAKAEHTVPATAGPALAATPSSATPGSAPRTASAAHSTGNAATPPGSPGATQQQAPPKLACLARHYAGSLVFAEQQWWLELAGGKRLLFDDGRTKSFEQLLDEPDLEDMFRVPYATGTITPVNDLEHDPGRFRVEALFRHTYGETKQAVRKQLVQVVVAGQKLSVHPRVAKSFQAVAARLDELMKGQPELSVFLEGLAGTFNWRTIAGTKRLSSHSFGISVDLNTRYSNYWRWQTPPQWSNQIPQPIVDAFEAEGFIWGGRWGHFDTMHFEYRPELLDPACARR